MPRRVGLPGASELFRPTDVGSEQPADAAGERPVRRRRTAAQAEPSPHEELRAEHGLAVDRGRIVRAAIASALASIAADPEGADVVRRLAAES